MKFYYWLILLLIAAGLLSLATGSVSDSPGIAPAAYPG